LQDEHLARKGIIESDCKNLLETIAEHIETDTEQFKQEQRRIEQQLNSDLKASGSDDTAVALSTRLKEAERLEREARSFQRKADDYRDWLQNRWQQHPELCRQRDDCQRRILQLQDEIERLKQDYKRQRAQLNQQISAQEEQLKKTTVCWRNWNNVSINCGIVRLFATKTSPNTRPVRCRA
jgi:predicted  nucleic acid-binding Zn-ribbon protein